MAGKPNDEILHDHNHDGVDRRGFLKCMAWAGTGAFCVMQGGVLKSYSLSAIAGLTEKQKKGELSFVQISDSHMGFNKPANTDVAGTLKAAVDKINALPTPPSFVMHTGDLTHGQKPGAFDTVAELLKGVKAEKILYIPGEHDVFLDGGKEFLGRYANGGPGWQSFDYKGVHFVGLINVLNFKAGGLGNLGPDQLDWLKKDVVGLGSSTPIVVFAHVPLWAVYPKWGWVTEDGGQALSFLRRFGSVTVLNGHIHQIMQKVEGNISFHTALSTAFPQPAPGVGAGPGPVKVPAEELRRVLGVRAVNYVQGTSRLAIVDSTLA